MSNQRCLLLAVALALGLTTAAAALEVPLTYEPLGEPQTEYLPKGATGVQLTDQAPAGCKLPAFNTEKPAFGRIKLAGREIPLALDCSKTGDKFYNRLTIDLNGNGDLLDDAPITSEAVGSPGDINMAFFRGIDLELQGGDAPVPFRFGAQVYKFGEGSLANMMIVTQCVYVGRIESGGKTWRIALGDANCDGSFNEKAKVAPSINTGGEARRIYAAGDRVALTAGEIFEYADQMTLGTHLALDGKLYAVKIDIGKEKLILTPVENGLATLKTPVKTTMLQLMSEDGKTCVMAWGPGDSLAVPAGNYQVLSYTIEKTAAGGDVWRASANAMENAPWIAAAPDAPGTLKLGPPFTIKAAVRDSQNRRVLADLSLNFSAHDVAGMEVGPIAHMKVDMNSLLPKPAGLTSMPKYEIRTADGKTVAQGQFEYG